MKPVMKAFSRRLIPAVMLSSLTMALDIGPGPGLSAQAQEQAGGHLQHPFKVAPLVTNLAIDGPGYFRMIDPGSKAEYYTRNGDFQLNQAGKLEGAQGFLLYMNFTVPPDSHRIAISENGFVYAQAGPDAEWEYLGMILLQTFPQPDRLQALEGHDGLFKASKAAGELTDHGAGQNGAGILLSGWLEDFSQPAGPPPESGCENPQAQTITQRPLDWVIEGSGYFSLLMPSSGQRFLTRQLRLYVNHKGKLISHQGYLLDPEIILPLLKGQPPEASFSRIDPDGTVWAWTASGQNQKVGSVTLSDVYKSESLQAMNTIHPTLYTVKPGSLDMFDFQPGQAGKSPVRSGMHEDCGQDLTTTPIDLLLTGAH